MKYYGNLTNRLMEGQKELPKLEVGMGVTEMLWSDRNAYEITKVIDQKHFKMRRYEAKHIGSYGENNWELISDPDGYEYEMVYRYGGWYSKVTYTKEGIENRLKKDGYILLDQKIVDKAMKDGVAYDYNKMNIYIGEANYYYDFEF